MPAKVVAPLVTSDSEPNREGEATHAAKDRLTWITAQGDRTEHGVTDDAQDASRARWDGKFGALCSTEFIAAAMDVGPARLCQRCVLIAHARAELRDFNERSRSTGRRSRRGRHAA